MTSPCSWNRGSIFIYEKHFQWQYISGIYDWTAVHCWLGDKSYQRVPDPMMAVAGLGFNELMQTQHQAAHQ